MAIVESDLARALEQATVAQRSGRLAEAERIYGTIIEARPDHFDALHLLGVINAQQGRPEEAQRLIGRALRIDPNFAPAHFHMGIVLQGLRRLEEALTSYERALALRPSYAEAHYNRGNVLGELGRAEDALRSYDLALAIRPDYAAALCNRGVILQELRRREEALPCYDAALAIEPDNLQALVNRGNLLIELNRFEEAVASYDAALAIRPDNAQASSSRGVALANLLRIEDALASYEAALAVQPDFGEAKFNASLCRLVRGDYARGWREYESRWSAMRVAKREFAQPLWLGGEDVRGRTVLVHSEQGMGDTIQFCRYAELLAARGARVIMEVQPPLTKLLTTLAGADLVVGAGEELPRFDFHVPMMSLPLAFGTSLATIPSRTPYLAAIPAKTASWRERLEALPGRKVGLVWAGESRRNDPQTELIDKRRSMQLGQFAPLAGLAGIVFVSLQKGAPAAQAGSPPNGMTLLDWTEELRDFADTAALVEALDLVIGVDTSVVHLAGALGRPVWVLNRFDTCWRWLLDREDSPWYPTLRLFRQPRPGDWRSVLDRVALALADFTRR